MQKIETTTTSFKKALKTVTDTMTATEQKKYDVGIEIYYEGEIGTITMEHPLNGIIVSADFEGEHHDGIFDTLFYIGSLSEDLKKYRKKEALYLDIGMDTVIISTEKGIFYESVLEEERIDIPKLTNVYTINRKDFIEVLNVGQAVTKTSFHDSTMSLHIVGAKNKLHVKATNFSQIALSELNLDKAIIKPFQLTLSAKEITKVRNVLERGKGKDLMFSINGDMLTLKSLSTSVAFKHEKGIDHINANKVLKTLVWDDEIFTLSVKDSKETVAKQYEHLRTGEKEKNENGIENFQNIYLKKNNNTKEVKFSQEQDMVCVSTRDMNNLLSKLPDEMEVAFSKQAILMNNKTNSRKTMVLIPIANVE